MFKKEINKQIKVLESKIVKLKELEKEDDKIESDSKRFFLDSINGLICRWDNDKYINYYDSSNEIVMYYDRETKIFTISYKKIWSELELKTGYKSGRISRLCTAILKEHFNYKNIKTRSSPIIA